MIPDLDDFEGTWRLERRIEDRRGGPDGVFRGTAVFLRDNDDLRYREEGDLRLAGHAPVRAERRYRWSRRGDRIVVTYPDLKPFYSFSPAIGIGTHFCAPDVYRVAYDFEGWPHWTARWDVNGPRKDYTATSLYTPG
jgi:hypothetical protein